MSRISIYLIEQQHIRTIHSMYSSKYILYDEFRQVNNYLYTYILILPIKNDNNLYLKMGLFYARSIPPMIYQWWKIKIHKFQNSQNLNPFQME